MTNYVNIVIEIIEAHHINKSDKPGLVFQLYDYKD